MTLLSWRLAFLLATAAVPLINGRVTVSTQPAQTMNGIGASGAWWPNNLGQYPESVRSHVADLLFSQNHLGLSSYRYNLGGGGVWVGTPSRATETFFVSPGVYNWSADAGGVYFLRKAAQFRVPQLTLFVNSAPPAFTTNNRSCAGGIVDALIPDYAKYIADVVTHFKDEGVIFTHISPMNEPDSSFGTNDTPCGQEGMMVTPSQRPAVINALRSALDNAKLHTVQIISDETSSAQQLLSEMPTWLPAAAPSLGAFCHHQYSFPSDSLVEQIPAMVNELAPGKETWFSEICCFKAINSSLQHTDPAAPQTFGAGYQPGMVGALKLGNMLRQSFAVIGDVHFDWWTALSDGIGCDPVANVTCIMADNENGYNDGLMYYDNRFASNGNFAVYLTKRFHLVRHFTHFVRIGAKRLPVDDLPNNVQGLASKDSKGGSLILMNMSPNTIPVDLSGVTSLGMFHSAVQTTASADWETIRKAVDAVPGLSITTVLFQ
ncbi:glycoside hydrolase [Rickenella mellea]|uniref:Glycoside hydrolase n=1 Tax=Rickenella mellea TaxID=50990 RepID=A0A4Y7QG69_9AGAM|nr:glycoside hydrolase [Rickenella mellea]